MRLYAGIDLHSNNSVIVVLRDDGREVYRKRLANDLGMIADALRSCGNITSVAVESTFNWYWLVDGLQDAGFDVQLVNTAAVKQYDGLKHGGDFSDAMMIADILQRHAQTLSLRWDKSNFAGNDDVPWLQTAAAALEEMRADLLALGIQVKISGLAVR